MKTALDVAATARSNGQIDREIAGATEAIDKAMRRVFVPTVATRSFDWLDHQFSLTWRLWLNSNELAAPPTQVMSGGIDITSSVLARNHKGDDQPPYTFLEIDLSTNATFAATNTYQRAISVLGPFGYSLDETPGGTISALSTTSQTTATVSDGSLVGVGSIIRVDSERMIVTDKNMVDSGQPIQGALTASNAAVAVPVVDGTKFDTNEVIMVDSEKMRVDEVAGNNLVVTRAWDGSALAAHDANAEIYAARQVTVERGQLGTTAATHSANTAVAVHAVPALIRTLCVGETMTRLGFERSGYVQTIIRTSSGSTRQLVGAGIDALWQQVKDSYQRKIRTRTSARSI